MSKSYHVPKDRDNKTNLVVSGLWQIQKDSMSVRIEKMQRLKKTVEEPSDAMVKELKRLCSKHKVEYKTPITFAEAGFKIQVLKELEANQAATDPTMKLLKNLAAEKGYDLPKTNFTQEQASTAIKMLTNKPVKKRKYSKYEMEDFSRKEQQEMSAFMALVSTKKVKKT